MQAAFDQCLAVGEGRAWCALLIAAPDGEPYGTGKTHLAIAAMKSYGLERSRFWKVPAFLDWVKQAAKGWDWNLTEVLRGYVTGEALVVFDDLGAENRTDWACEQLYRVLDARYDARIPTIITSNELATRLDGRIRSRYREGLVACHGEDLR